MALLDMFLAARIESLSPGALALAFVAGLVSFLSPCVLPLVPAYLSYVSGVGVEALAGERRRVLAVALAFVGGFTVVFTILGAGAGGVGGLLDDYREQLVLVAGVFFIVSGLVIAGVLRLPSLKTAFSPRSGGVWRAFVAGAAVSVGWTPCVGYVLGSILVLAGSRENALSGALLLVVYSLGLGVPFVVTALTYGWAMRRLGWIRRHYRTVEIASGVLLVAFGILLVTGRLAIISSRLPTFEFLGL